MSRDSTPDVDDALEIEFADVRPPMGPDALVFAEAFRHVDRDGSDRVIVYDMRDPRRWIAAAPEDTLDLRYDSR